MRHTYKVASILIWLCILPLFAACQSNKEPGELSDKEKLDLYFERALRYYEMRELDRCQDQVQRGLEIDPENERLMLMLGRCYQTRGDLQGVLTAEKIFREHPAKNDYRVHLCLAGSLERKGSFYYEAAGAVASGERYTDAADPAARAEELNTEANEAWTEAVESYEATLERWPGSFEALNGLMRTTVFLKDYDNSLVWSEKFLQSIAESTEVFLRRQKELQATGSATVEIERTLIENSDLEVDVRLHRAELLHLKGDLAASLAELDAAMGINEDIPDLYARRGQVLHKLGEYKRSNDSLERYLSLSDSPFDDPNIRQAFEMIEKNKIAMRASRSN